jgi:hypothetical protein
MTILNSSLIHDRTNQTLAQPEKPCSENQDDLIVSRCSNIMNYLLLKLHISIQQTHVSGMSEKNKLYTLEKNCLNIITREKNKVNNNDSKKRTREKERGGS